MLDVLFVAAVEAAAIAMAGCVTKEPRRMNASGGCSCSSGTGASRVDVLDEVL